MCDRHSVMTPMEGLRRVLRFKGPCSGLPRLAT